jgi:hypothetical protein
MLTTSIKVVLLDAVEARCAVAGSQPKHDSGYVRLITSAPAHNSVKDKPVSLAVFLFIG